MFLVAPFWTHKEAKKQVGEEEQGKRDAEEMGDKCTNCFSFAVEACTCDFNVTMKVEEHSSGGSQVTSEMQDLIDCANEIEMEDVNSTDLSKMTLEEVIGRLKTYEERIKYKKGKQVDNQEKLMLTRHENKGKDMTKDSGDSSKKEFSTTSTQQFQCPMLKPSNYSLWVFRMQIILEANGLWETIEPNEKTQANNRKDKTAIAFSYQALPEDQLLQITKHKTAKAIWDALKTRCIGEERVQQARLQTLKSDFEMLHMKEDDTIDTFTTKLTTLVNKAASLGHTMKDGTLVRKLLNDVPDRYLQIVASIEQYSYLSEMTLEEAIGRLKTYEEMIKYKKGKQVDNQKKLMLTRHENKRKYFRGRGRGKHRFSQGRNHENFKEEKKDEETSHMNFNKNNFKKSNYDTSKLQCYKCKKIWHIAPKCPQRTKPNKQSNLVKEDLEPTLLMTILEDEEQKVSLHEEDVGYKETNKDSLWYLDNGASNHMTGVREHFKELNEKVSGKKAKAISTLPLDLVYGDLCGPITPPPPSGKKYIFLLVDDYSRYMWVYFLNTKNQAFDTFKEDKKLIENELRTTLKILRTDRGGEFTSNEFKQYCKENGIARQLTAPYSPQQNGLVERRNRTIMSTTRCMMKATNMPQNFWAEAVRHAIYILNSVPTKALADITPYEAIKRRKPNLENLRVFGRIAYAKVPSQHLTKLDDRSTRMVYLGNEQGSKSYRRICVSRDVKFKENETWDWKDYMSEHINDKPEWIDFKIGNLEVTNEHHDQGFQPIEEDNEFPNNDDDDYASPTRDSPTHSQTPHTPSTRSSEVNSQVTPNISTQLNYQTEDEPKNYKEASSDQKWIEAMKAELDSINRNNTWKLTTLPKGPKAIGLKRKRAIVALSSCESEFIAATAAATQALWLKRLLRKLTHSEEDKVTIRVDNKSAIILMKNPQEGKLEEGDEALINSIFQGSKEVIRRINDDELDDDNDRILPGLNSGETLNFGSKVSDSPTYYLTKTSKGDKTNNKKVVMFVCMHRYCKWSKWRIVLSSSTIKFSVVKKSSEGKTQGKDKENKVKPQIFIWTGY
nr:zinc finger, CCHC-type [Tanacetum cinerariifolium]